MAEGDRPRRGVYDPLARGLNFGTNRITYHVIPIGVIQGYMLSLNPPGK
jgi:hypothetical protein